MRRIVTTIVTLLSVAVLLVAIEATARAQATSSPPAEGQLSEGSTPSLTQVTPEASEQERAKWPLALKGHCPVCITEMSQWVEGNPDFQIAFDGRTYRFPGQKQKEMFQANVTKYLPALGGDCIVTFLETGKRTPGSVQHSVRHNGRLFLFVDGQAKETFEANPAKYRDADLAFEGNCPICRVEMKTTMQGKADFTVFHKGFRYFFPSERMRSMFLANPDKYRIGGKPTQ